MRIRYLTILICIAFFSCKREKGKISTASPTIVNQIVPEKSKKTFIVQNVGDTLDVLNDVYIFYNKSMNNTSGRNVSEDGYNIGLKWQCVEFVKRYYLEHLNHKMPNSYGHAKDFYNSKFDDGELNKDRNLIQYSNASQTKPKVNDLVIFDGNVFNPYGHVAIISNVGDDEIEIVQQNVGKKSRDRIDIQLKNGKWSIDESSILGWLRKK